LLTACGWLAGVRWQAGLLAVLLLTAKS